jgi:hypothetical protein
LNHIGGIKPLHQAAIHANPHHSAEAGSVTRKQLISRRWVAPASKLKEFRGLQFPQIHAWISSHVV